MIAPATCVTTVLLVTLAALAGCGGEPAPVTDKDAVLRFKLDEYTIRPQSVRVFATAIPMPIKIVATNNGRLTHNVKVKRIESDVNPDDPVLAAAENKPLGGTPTARPGESVRTKQPIPLAPGTYRLTDTIGNHDNLGQYGTLIIEPPPGR